MKNTLAVIVAGLAIFSMFFGGGNLTFPLWVGSQTSSILLSSLGFILSGVLLPFLGIAIILFFKGDYESCLGVFGKGFGKILAFTLLLFWIPLGSGPRCNQLAYGAWCCQWTAGMPMWAYSLIYSAVVFLLTLGKNSILDVLGKIITPVLVLSLLFLVTSGISAHGTPGPTAPQLKDFYSAFVAGYSTMDFVAAIFFSSAVISLIKEKSQEKFDLRFVRNASLFAIALLSLIYVGMIAVGHVNHSIIFHTPREQLMAMLGNHLFDPKFQFVIFIVITFSVLSTSMALSLVFSDFLQNIFKMSHASSLFLSVFSSFAISVIGFERLATLISLAMSILYPLLLLVAMIAVFKKYKSTREVKYD